MDLSQPVMSLNDNKAGMEGLDKESISRIIEEASKGSKFYEKQKTRDRSLRAKMAEQKAQADSLTDDQIAEGFKQAQLLINQLEASRDLSRTICHIDMDAFYASVEMRDDPALKNVPMAVGGESMLSTSNYIARRFGVRAAMPGFIARKLCPELVIVPCNFDKYTAISEQICEIFADYDPNFSRMGLDEAYIDLTDHLVWRETSTIGQRTFQLKAETNTNVCTCSIVDEENVMLNSSQDLFDSVDKSDAGTSICDKCQKDVKPEEETTSFGVDIESAVQEIRFRIEQKTQLTASAGIAPNTMLAKVCSDFGKPNGQYRIEPTRDAVMDFIQKLPVKKIPGVGKVSEKMLESIGVHTCFDLYEKRSILYNLHTPTSFQYFIRISLGISDNRLSEAAERKSMSVERTFDREINQQDELLSTCHSLCESLASDLQKENLSGKTLTLKLKTVFFDVLTRAYSFVNPTNDAGAMFSSAQNLLKTEIRIVHPNPLRLRLIGVRMSNFVKGNFGLQLSIKGAFGNVNTTALDQESSDSDLEVLENSYTGILSKKPISATESYRARMLKKLEEKRKPAIIQTPIDPVLRRLTEDKNSGLKADDVLSSDSFFKALMFREGRFEFDSETNDKNDKDSDIGDNEMLNILTNLYNTTGDEESSKSIFSNAGTSESSGSVITLSGETEFTQTCLKPSNEYKDCDSSPLPPIQTDFESSQSVSLTQDSESLSSQNSYGLPVDVLRQPKSEVPPLQTFLCPVCGAKRLDKSLEAFNKHLDYCLSQGTVRHMLKEDRSSGKTLVGGRDECSTTMTDKRKLKKCQSSRKRTYGRTMDQRADSPVEIVTRSRARMLEN